MDTDKNKENKVKWARLLRKLIMGIDRAVLGHWIRSIPLNREKYNVPRLKRFYSPPYELKESQKMENNSSILLQILQNYTDFFRALEPEQALVAIPAVQHMMLSIPENGLTWYEKVYLNEFVDTLITFGLNEKDRTLVKRLKNLLVEIGKKYRSVMEE